MAKRNRWIPFNWLPGSWGLSGKIYEETKARYELDGEDLERRLIEINNEGIDRDIEFLKLDKKYGRINSYEFDLKVAEVKYPELESIERQEAMLKADFDAGKITQNDYEKTLATARNEPWVGVVDNGYDKTEGVNGLYFELDWNHQWVEFLQRNGYVGSTEEQIVEQWFADVCRSQAEEVAEQEAMNEPIPFNSGRVINRVRGNNGGTEYS
jgi:hypothetical protein